MFDRSKKNAMNAAEDGAAVAALPQFQPTPGGFGKRQTPVGGGDGQRRPLAAAPARSSAPAGNVTPRAANDSAFDNRDAQQRGAAIESQTVESETGAPDVGLVAIGGGLATFDDHRIAGADRLATRLEQWLGREFRHVRDVPCETTLTVAGALAGFAAQHGIWEALVKPGRMAIQEAFVVIETSSDETFFFGDLLNDILASPKPEELSVWKIVAGAARAMGAEALPDLAPMFKYCAESAGTVGFGLPNLPNGHLPTILPRDAIGRYWPEALRILGAHREGGSDAADAARWALTVAVATQKLMLGMKDRIDPSLAAQVVMEAAIPMSRIDPMTVPKE